MAAHVEAIFTASTHGSDPAARPDAMLEVDVGLLGDRYAGSGIVSLIEAEAVEAFNEATGLAVLPAETGRNILTRGLALNALVGRQFSVGDAVLEGTELCEPCATLGKKLSTERVSGKDVVRAFTHKAGIRARVLTSGAVTPGTEITA